MPQTYPSGQTLSEMLRVLTDQPDPGKRRDVEILLAHLLQVPRHRFVLDKVDVSHQIHLKALAFAKRRAAGEPVAKIIGQKEFWSLTFKVNQHTLDPRPDSETLIETVLKHVTPKNKAYKILDLGTGTGCLALSLLSEYPSAHALAVDVSSAALDVAAFNAQNLGLHARIELQCHDWNRPLAGKYDIIVSNPPYITEQDFKSLAVDVRQFDPYTALVSGPTGLEDYKKIAVILDNNLAEDGFFAIELGDGQVKGVRQILRQHDLQDLGVQNDLAGKARCLFGTKQRYSQKAKS